MHSGIRGLCRDESRARYQRDRPVRGCVVQSCERSSCLCIGCCVQVGRWTACMHAARPNTHIARQHHTPRNIVPCMRHAVNFGRHAVELSSCRACSGCAWHNSRTEAAERTAHWSVERGDSLLYIIIMASTMAAATSSLQPSRPADLDAVLASVDAPNNMWSLDDLLHLDDSHSSGALSSFPLVEIDAEILTSSAPSAGIGDDRTAAELHWHAGIRLFLNERSSDHLQPGCQVTLDGRLIPAAAAATLSAKFGPMPPFKSAIQGRAGKVGNFKSDTTEVSGISISIIIKTAPSGERVVFGLIEEPGGTSQPSSVATCKPRLGASEMAQFTCTNNRSQLSFEWTTMSQAWQSMAPDRRCLRAAFVLVEYGDRGEYAAVLDIHHHYFWVTHDGNLPPGGLSPPPQLTFRKN